MIQRSIKFRVFCPHTKQFFYTESKNWTHLLYGGSDDCIAMEFCLPWQYKNNFKMGEENWSIKDLIWSEATDLLDSKGTKIWEGDILGYKKRKLIEKYQRIEFDRIKAEYEAGQTLVSPKYYLYDESCWEEYYEMTLVKYGKHGRTPNIYGGDSEEAEYIEWMGWNVEIDSGHEVIGNIFENKQLYENRFLEHQIISMYI